MKTYFITGRKNSSVQILKPDTGNEDLEETINNNPSEISNKKLNNNHNEVFTADQNGTKSLPSLGRWNHFIKY